jgi:5'-deoxynucleotidase YfbR-like HD superfamily hydrolase
MAPALAVRKALRSGGVQRYHAQPDIPTQSTAEHMWGVAMLMMMFYPHCSKNLILAALTHDCGEVGVGDIPSPTKAAHPDIRDTVKGMEFACMEDMHVEPWEEHLSVNHKVMLKICDVLEGLQYTAKHVHMTGMGVETLNNWIELAQNLPLNTAQQVFVKLCLDPPKPTINKF